MELYILNKNYEQIAVIDEAESKLWHKKYNDAGECEIYVPCSDEMLSILQKGYYIFRYDDDMFCEIVKVEIKTDVENGDYIIATAQDIAVSVLANRIVWDQVVFTGTVGNFIQKVITDNLINSTQSVRNVPNLIFDASNLTEFNANIDISVVTDDILQLIISTCKTYNIGFRIKFDIDTKKLVFFLYKGENKASTTSETYIEFSPTYANIISSDYKEDAANYKNFAVVGAKDTDESLMYITVYRGNVEPSGADRKELYVDATSTSREITAAELLQMFPNATLSGNTYYVTISNVSIAVATVDGDKITVTDFTYQRILRIIGQNALYERVETQTFSGEVDTIDTYAYKTDYNLGDTVKVINEYGIEAEAQITEVMESEDTDNGYQIEPKFEYLN